MEKEKRNKVIGIVAGIVGFIASAIGIFVFVTGKNLPDIFPAKPANAQDYVVGEIVHFGQWDWRVLAVEDGKALLIAGDIIEQRPYNDKLTGVTWENCTLRAYLNGEFLEKFSAQERAKICETENVNGNNQWFGTNGGRNTTDKVFLLSIEEVVKYFGDSRQLKNKNPRSEYWIDDQYNDERAAKFNNDSLWWWLRSPGPDQYNAADIRLNGNVSFRGYNVHREEGGLRPALWAKQPKKCLLSNIYHLKSRKD